MPSMPMTMTFLPALRETRCTLPSQYDAAPPAGGGQPPTAAGRFREQSLRVRSSTGARVSHQPTWVTNCVLRFAVRCFGAARPPTSALPSMYSGTGTPNMSSTVGPMSSSRGFSRLDRAGCRTACRARATGRRSGRRSRPSCCRGRPPRSSGRWPSPTRRDSRAGSRRSGPGPCPCTARGRPSAPDRRA